MVAVALQNLSEPTVVKLAREIAKDLQPLDELLRRHGVSEEQWELLKNHHRFVAILEAEVLAWQAAKNTHERTKMKAAALVEEWLPEGYARLHDSSENLPAKVELLKTIVKIAGMDASRTGVAGESAGERFSVTINLGADTQLKFEKEMPNPPKVIESVAKEIE